MSPKRKSAAKSAGVALVPQPHGGALLPGGVPGNRGGTGRPQNELRAAMRASLEARLYIAEKILDDPNASNSDKLRVLDWYARYGIGSATIEPTVNIGQLHLDALKSVKERTRVAATLPSELPSFVVRRTEPPDQGSGGS